MKALTVYQSEGFMMTKQQLKKEIELLRTELYAKWKRSDYTDKDIVQISKKLDKKIDKYMKLKS
ncbi:aspartyl-phosphate phosphatase Spo0E family protein [Aquibacillus sediminis]|uniref:aspartyl-phosphate phosphatase Spo0E family protein n=1 Tax=Aquibacillus sediminis TaxID=2574734 RepID=UPI0011096268|nr:aspartyl-phosphate phosphatase Spo0E family protein [Aquibacillus sediminis]